MFDCHPAAKSFSVLSALVVLLLVGACLAPSVWAQRVTQMSPLTLSFVSHAQPLLAITHVRVIDGTGAPARENQTVLLRDGLIAAVGKHVKVPGNATVIDGSGQTLIPGLVGMHDHMFYPAPKVNPLAKEAIYPDRHRVFPSCTWPAASPASAPPEA